MTQRPISQILFGAAFNAAAAALPGALLGALLPGVTAAQGAKVGAVLGVARYAYDEATGANLARFQTAQQDLNKTLAQIKLDQQSATNRRMAQWTQQATNAGWTPR